MRKELLLNDEQYERLLNASKPVPYMIIGGIEPRSPQENANDAWRALGQELGFDYMSVRPVAGEPRKFTADVEAE